MLLSSIILLKAQKKKFWNEISIAHRLSQENLTYNVKLLSKICILLKNWVFRNEIGQISNTSDLNEYIRSLQTDDSYVCIFKSKKRNVALADVLTLHHPTIDASILVNINPLKFYFSRIQLKHDAHTRTIFLSNHTFLQYPKHFVWNDGDQIIVQCARLFPSRSSHLTISPSISSHFKSLLQSLHQDEKYTELFEITEKKILWLDGSQKFPTESSSVSTSI